MPVLKEHQNDVEHILGMRGHNGADYWTTEDGRWGKGSPFSTYDCVLMLHELGLKKSDPALQGAAGVIFDK